MKLDQIKNTNFKVIGDIEETTISIPDSEMEMMVSLLTTNLYSNKIGSLVREITSNAWDSHVVAGNENPILLNFREVNNEIFLSIRDYGTGLDKKGFDDVYRKLGVSTKRESNDQIGGFGIGKFSALAYSEQVEINSYYNGIKYTYVLYKDGTKIKSPLVAEVETIEPNGLEVIVKVKDNDIKSFANEIYNQLPYFENLVVLNETNIEILNVLQKDINSTSIEDFGLFKMESNSSQEDSLGYYELPKILLGKVLYPINYVYLSDNYPDKYKILESYLSNYSCPIGVKFEIGELKVTPNREEIQYDEESSNLILDRLIESLTFINSEVIKFFDSDYNDFFNYKKVLFDTKSIPLKYDFNIGLKHSNLITKNLTFKGIHISKNMIQKLERPSSYYSSISYSSKPFIRATEHTFSERYNHKRHIFSFNTLVENSTLPDDRIFSSSTNLKKIEKDYIKQNLVPRNNSVDIYEYLESEDRYIREVYYNFISCIRENTKRAARNPHLTSDIINIRDIHLFKHIFKHVCIPKLKENYNKFIDYSEVNLPEQWVKKYKEDLLANKKKKASSDFVNTSIFRYSETPGNGSYVATDTKDILIEDLSQKNILTVYSDKSDEKIKEFAELNHSNVFNKIAKGNQKIRVIAVAKSRLKDIDGIDNVISLEEFMKGEHKRFAKLATALIIAEDLGYILETFNNNKNIILRYLERWTKEDTGLIQEVINYLNSNCVSHTYAQNFKCYQDIINIAKKNNNIDYAILNKYKSVRKTMKLLSTYNNYRIRLSNHNGSNITDFECLYTELQTYKKNIKPNYSMLYKYKSK